MLKNYYLINSRNADKYIEGIRFISNSGITVSNYPKDHIANGIQKNNATNYGYKKLVRIFKRLRNEMVDAGLADGEKITSFLIECLVWNVPNNIITGYSNWTTILRQAIDFSLLCIRKRESVLDCVYFQKTYICGQFSVIHSHLSAIIIPLQ